MELIGSKSVGSGGVCATLCGKTESAASIVDIGDITLKTIKSYILLHPT